MSKKMGYCLLIASFISFALVSVCLFLTFFVDSFFDAQATPLSWISGIGCWLFTIVGILLQVWVTLIVRRHYGGIASRDRRVNPGIGLLRIFSNRLAIISDGILCVSAVASAICLAKDATSLWAHISLPVLFLSFCGHCIFNGKNYYYITRDYYVESQLTKTEEK